MTWIDAVAADPRGKIDRSALPDPVNGLAQDTTPCTAGGDGEPALSQMVAVWEGVLGTGHVGPDDNFFDLGGHSLLAIRLMDRIEASFGVRMPISAIFTSPTPGRCWHPWRRLEKARLETSSIPLQPEGTRPPLYCIHGVPGTLFEFDALVRQIGKDQPVYGLQSPGLDGVTPGAGHRGGDGFALRRSRIRDLRPHGPYHFISYCAGGAFAYEVARQLESAGETVGFLGFIDYPAPKQKVRSTFWSGYRVVHAITPMAPWPISAASGAPARGKKRSRSWRSPGSSPGKCCGCPQRSTAAAAGRLHPGTAAGPYPEWMMNMSGVQQAIIMKNYDAIARYHPAACEVKVTVFMSGERVRSAWRFGRYERTFGWKRLARRGVRCHVLEGDHNSIISPDNSSQIARIIRDCIDETGGAGDGRQS